MMSTNANFTQKFPYVDTLKITIKPWLIGTAFSHGEKHQLDLYSCFNAEAQLKTYCMPDMGQEVCYVIALQPLVTVIIRRCVCTLQRKCGHWWVQVVLTAQAQSA